MCWQIRDFLRQDCQTSFWPWDVPQNAPASSGTIKNASTSSSSTAPIKDVQPACAPAAAWTRRRTGSQFTSSSRILQPLGLTAAHYRLLELYQPRGNNNSDGPVRCNVLRDLRGSFPRACKPGLFLFVLVCMCMCMSLSMSMCTSMCQCLCLVSVSVFVFSFFLLFVCLVFCVFVSLSCFDTCRRGVREKKTREKQSKPRQLAETEKQTAVALMPLVTNSKTLVGRCRDRPSRALPLTFPNVNNRKSDSNK